MTWEIVFLIVSLSAIAAVLLVEYWKRLEGRVDATEVRKGFDIHAESIRKLALEVESLKKKQSEQSLVQGMRMPRG